MRPPMYKIAHSWDYLKSSISRKSWDPNANPDFDKEEDIRGRIAIVTGSNAGIGKQAVVQLAKRGAKVIMACRDLQKAQIALDSIKEKIPNAQIEIMELDLADFQSIRDFVIEFSRKHEKLNILVNNAGVINTNGKYLMTKDGFELHMGINHFGPFLLTKLLVNSLKKGAPSRVVTVSSSNMVRSPLDLEDLVMRKGLKTGDSGCEPYNVSKLANSMCIRRLASLVGHNSGIRMFQMCPGFVATDLFRNERGLKACLLQFALKTFAISTEMGTETIVYCATSKKLLEEGCGIGEIYRFSDYWDAGNTFLDPEDKDTVKLYQISEKLVGF